MSTDVLTTVQTGDVLPGLEVQLRREDVVRYSGASTDFNPIHFSDRHARAIGLPGVVAHGMWTMGTALSVVTQWAGGPERIASYKVRFTRAVVVPDDDRGVTLQVGGTVTEVTDTLVTIALDVSCGDEKVLGAATVEVHR